MWSLPTWIVFDYIYLVSFDLVFYHLDLWTRDFMVLNIFLNFVTFIYSDLVDRGSFFMH